MNKMSQIQPQIRGIYAFLKKYKIEHFAKYNKDEYEGVLIKFGLQDHWYRAKEREWTSASIMNPFTGNRNQLDNSIMTILSISYNQPWFLIFLDDLLDALIKTKNIENFEYNEFKQILVQCGCEIVVIEKMKFWSNEGTIKKKENSSQVIEKFDLGTLNHLENSLIHKIFEEVIANPTRYHKDTRNISPQRKKAVKERDKFICQLCNEKFKEEELEVDHIFPYGAGGSNEEHNLMALCKECNGNKTAKLDYYRSVEGKYKLMENIQIFAKSFPIIHDFGKWLEEMGNKRKRI